MNNSQVFFLGSMIFLVGNANSPNVSREPMLVGFSVALFSALWMLFSKWVQAEEAPRGPGAPWGPEG
jgi:hypothetical protein